MASIGFGSHDKQGDFENSMDGALVRKRTLLVEAGQPVFLGPRPSPLVPVIVGAAPSPRLALVQYAALLHPTRYSLVVTSYASPATRYPLPVMRCVAARTHPACRSRQTVFLGPRHSDLGPVFWCVAARTHPTRLPFDPLIPAFSRREKGWLRWMPVHTTGGRLRKQ